MKISGKLTALLLAAILMFALFAGCQSTAKTEDEKPVLTVALSPDFSPMEFVDTSKTGQEQYVGFDVTLAKYIADELGMELEIKPMSFDACQTAVQMGTVNISISGYSWTEKRAENYLLSDYYYAGDNETAQTLIVPADKAGTYHAAEDFSGLKVAAQTASLQMNLVTEQLPADTEIVEFKAIDDAVLALKTGKVDAVAVAEGNGKAIIVNNPDVGMSGFLFEVDEAAENNVILINKNDTEMLEKVNACLAKAYEAGLYGPWYEEAQALAGIETAADVSYDDEGNVAED